LAIAIGNIHGVFKSDKNPHLFLDRLEEINKAVSNNVGLVLHGGSGTPEEDVKKAIQLGVVKVNVNTELRMAYTNTLKNILENNLNEVAPYKLMSSVIEIVQKIVEDKIRLFGSDNKL